MISDITRQEIVDTIKFYRKSFKDDKGTLNGVLELFENGTIDLDTFLIMLWNKGYMTGYHVAKDKLSKK